MDDKERFPHYTPADHFVRKLRPIFFVLVAVSAPVMMISYVHMIRQLYFAFPLWATIGIVISHIVTWITLSMYVDQLTERSS